MSLAALLTVLGANIVAAPLVRSERPDFARAFAGVLAPTSAAFTTVAGLPDRRGNSGYPATLRYQPAASPEMVVRVGNRRRGPELELGALGGGRADAPGLVHVGIGFDF